MNEFEDIDSELEAVFTQRPSALSRPSLRDVKQRARRHQRQRKAGVLSACALVGVGGVAVIAQRSPSNQTTAGGLEGDPSTTMCFPATTIGVVYVADTTPYPSDNPVLTYYVVQPGDNPTTVANAFGVTLQELNDANAATPGYMVFSVGLAVAIPMPMGDTTTTMPADYVPGVAGTNVPGVATTYTLAAGDFPSAVAQMFGITVAELNAANLDVPGYGPFAVGTVINIPAWGDVDTATTFPDSTTSTLPDPNAFPPVIGDTSCGWGADPMPGYIYRCTGSPVVEADDYWYFKYCEQIGDSGIVVNGEPVVATTVGFTKATVVQVANCSNQEGVAHNLSNALAAEGFTTAEPDMCTIDLPITKIIYNPDDPFGLPVAQTLALYLGNAAVEASGPVVPTLTLGTWAPGSSVIVLLGDDLAGKTLAQIASQSSTATTTTQY